MLIKQLELKTIKSLAALEMKLTSPSLVCLCVYLISISLCLQQEISRSSISVSPGRHQHCHWDSPTVSSSNFLKKKKKFVATEL